MRWYGHTVEHPYRSGKVKKTSKIEFHVENQSLINIKFDV